MQRVTTSTGGRKPMSDADWLVVSHHLLHVRVPAGSVERSVRGGDVAKVVLNAMSLAARAGWGLLEGNALGLLCGLQGVGVMHPRTSFKSVAGAALTLLSTLTPLVEVVGHGRYRLHCEAPRYWTPEIKAALASERADA